MLKRSGVVLYPPRLPVIPLAIRDVASIHFRSQKGCEVVPEFSSNQSLPLLCDALLSPVFLAFPSDTHQSTLAWFQGTSPPRFQQGDEAEYPDACRCTGCPPLATPASASTLRRGRTTARYPTYSHSTLACAVRAPSTSTCGASVLSKNPTWNLPARGTDELVPAARSIPKSVLLFLALMEHS